VGFRNTAVKTLRAILQKNARENASMRKQLRPTEPECLVVPADQVATLLGISVRHFWACHASGTLGPRPISLGRSKRWRLDELHAWLEAGAPDRARWDEIKKNAGKEQPRA
jgi:predicted DNA-binding transcriptional regulator AlpA